MVRLRNERHTIDYVTISGDIMRATGRTGFAGSRAKVRVARVEKIGSVRRQVEVVRSEAVR